MTVGARPVLSTGGVGGGEPGSKRGVVELAVAVAGSRGGGGPTVVPPPAAGCCAGQGVFAYALSVELKYS